MIVLKTFCWHMLHMLKSGKFFMLVMHYDLQLLYVEPKVLYYLY